MNAKKFSLILILSIFISLIAISAVSAADNAVADISVADLSVNDVNIISHDVSESSNLGGSEVKKTTYNKVYNVSSANYKDFFNDDGKLKSNISDNVSLDFSGEFKDKKFVITKNLNLTSSGSAKFINSFFNITKGADGSFISNLKFNSTRNYAPCINIDGANHITVYKNTILSSGEKSFAIYLKNSNYDIIIENDLETKKNPAITNLGSPSCIVLDGSHYNNISSNDVKVQDSNGIYLTTYLSKNKSNYNYIFNNTVHSTLKALNDSSYSTIPSSFCYGIQMMGFNNTAINNTVYNVYRGISSPDINNKIIGNNISGVHGNYSTGCTGECGGDYGIYANEGTLIINNTISSSILKNGIYAGRNSIISGNTIDMGENSIIKDSKAISLESDNKIAIENIDVSNNLIKGNCYGVYISGFYRNVLIFNNTMDCNNTGVYLRYKSSEKYPDYVYIMNNDINTTSDTAINLDSKNSKVVILNDNELHNKSTKGNVSNGTIFLVNVDTFNDVFDEETNYYQLKDIVSSGSYIVFSGNLTLNKAISIMDLENLTLIGLNTVLKGTTLTVNNVNNTLIKNLVIENNGVPTNCWGIHIANSNNISAIENTISVYDNKSAIGMYLSNVKNSEVSNNIILSKGDYLTFALLVEGSNKVNIHNNNFYANGTGEIVVNVCGEACTGCVGSDCIGSNCIGSSCIGSSCIGSSCIGSSCIGSSCIGSSCIGSSCIGSSCIGSDDCIGGEDGTHIFQGIYRTYGVLITTSSNNNFENNLVNVSSQINQTKNPYNESINCVAGVFVHYNSSNNNLSNNKVVIDCLDPFAIGMGVVGGNGTSDCTTVSKSNSFISNNIDVKSSFKSTGIAVSHNASNSVVKSNTIKVRPLGSVGIDKTGSVNTSISSNVVDDGTTTIVVSNAIKYYGDSKTLVLYLKNYKNQGISGKNVSITIKGKTYTKTTDASGKASFAIGLPKGSYSVVANFVGDKELKKSSKKLTFKVVIPNIKPVNVKVKKGKYLQILYKDVNGKAIKKQNVIFKFKGKTYTATTNSKGMIQIKLNVKKATYTVSTKFKNANPYGTYVKSFKVKVI